MNTNHQTQPGSASNPSFKEACANYCRKLLAEINQTKEKLFAQFQQRLGQKDLLRLALNEAEALAWQTEYPHLLFPELATEKAQAAVAWEHRQQALNTNHCSLAFA